MTIRSTTSSPAGSAPRSPSASPSIEEARGGAASLARPQDAPGPSNRSAMAGPSAPRGAIPVSAPTRAAPGAAVAGPSRPPAGGGSARPSSPPVGGRIDQQSVQEVARRLHAAEVRRLQHLAQAHRILAGGDSLASARRQTGLDREALANHFDAQGRLLIGQAADRTLQSRATEHVQRLAALPRALRPVDLDRLAQVLRDNQGATPAELRDRARGAGVSRAALNHLFVEGTPLRDRLLTLPDEQRTVLLEAHSLVGTGPARATSPAPTPTPTAAPSRPVHPLHQRHLDETRRFEQVATAHRLLLAGHGFETAASEAGVPASLIARAFSPDGRLLLNAAGEGLAQSDDEATARRFAMLPRALDDWDLAKLAELMHMRPPVPGPLLRLTCVASGVSPQAVAHLFDAGPPVRERLATLPEAQRTALESGLAGASLPAADSPRPGPPAGVPAEPPGGPGLPPEVREFLHRHLLDDSDDSPVPTPPGSPGLGELSASDLAWLQQVLDESPPPADVLPPRPASPVVAGPSRPAGVSLAAPSEAAATPAAGLPQDLLAAVGEILRQEAEHAAKFARAQALLAGGATLGQAARAIGAHASTLGNSFSEQGHLLLTQAAERLLQARDPANAQAFASLPRALTRSDLALLGRVLRENPDAAELQLQIAAVGAKVSRRAIAHLFGTGAPLSERLATLPLEQQRSLGLAAVEQPPPRQPSGNHPGAGQPVEEGTRRRNPGRLAGGFADLPGPSWAAQAPRSQRGGLADPGTPPWAELEEPLSPADGLAFEASFEPQAGVGTPPQRGAAPPALDNTRSGLDAQWGASRPRTQPRRPAPAAATVGAKRPGPELQAPVATRPRLEEAGPSGAATAQAPGWGRQAPRTRPGARPAPGPRAPSPDSSSG
jgi:hypothetical protein